MTTRKHNPRNEAPVSLHPLKLEQALAKAMNVQPFLEHYDLHVKYLAGIRINSRDHERAETVANWLWKAIMGNDQWFALPPQEREHRFKESGARLRKDYMRERMLGQSPRPSAKIALDTERNYVLAQLQPSK